jgi:hypothetical protein
MEELPNEGHTLFTNIFLCLSFDLNVSIYFTVVAMNDNMQEIASPHSVTFSQTSLTRMVEMCYS